MAAVWAASSGTLDSSNKGCCEQFRCYMVVELFFLLRDDYSIELVWQYRKMYFVYIVDHSIISIHIAASENERLDHWWGMNIQQKRQRWRCGPAAEGQEGHGKGNDETQGVYVGLTNTKSDLSSCFFVPRQYIEHEIEILLLLCWVAWWQLLHGSKPSEKQEDGGNA